MLEYRAVWYGPRAIDNEFYGNVIFVVQVHSYTFWMSAFSIYFSPVFLCLLLLSYSSQQTHGTQVNRRMECAMRILCVHFFFFFK